MPYQIIMDKGMHVVMNKKNKSLLRNMGSKP